VADPKPIYFKGQAEFRKWLEKNHDKKTEQHLGFYKKNSAKKGITYQEALDEALCFGWIDGVVRSVDADRYMHRFTPRTSTSHWSNVNVRRFGELDNSERIAPPGRAAFERRTPERTGQMSFEQPPAELTAAQTKKLKGNAKAWAYYEAEAPSYRRVTKFWVTSAKQEATRERRLELLIRCSEKGERVPQYISPDGKKKAG
jgi:uncharacterized protein YdeI (YjbR/CyaY-like superfamily)